MTISADDIIIDNSTMKWWKIKFMDNDTSYYSVESYNHIYISANMVVQLTDHLLEVDGNNLYYPYKIDSITECNYFPKLIEEILNTYFRFVFNDSQTWETVKEFFPEIICDETLNTPEVIYRNALRFSYKDFIYEYSNGKLNYVK